MREKFGIVISVIIALSLLYFIAPINDLMTLFGRPQNVGEIAGQGISYEDFQEQVDKFTTINEVLSGSSVQNENSQKQIRDAAWQEFVDNMMFIPNAKAAGIKVGEKEMVDLTTGSNPSPIIANNPAFADENGNFNPANVVTFVQNLSDDESGRLRTYWNYLQNSVYTGQYYSKYGALVTKSNIDNKLMIGEAVEGNNVTANIDFVSAMYPMAKDSSIEVSSAEIKNYYKNHKNMFRQNASRDVEYVVFEVVPSAADIAATSDAIATVYDEFLATDNMKAFLLKNSERSLSNYWYKAGELETVNGDLDSQIFGGAASTPIIQDGNSFYAAKVMASAMVPDSAFVKHILLTGNDAKAKADSICAVVATKGSDFAALVDQFSADKGSQAEGEAGAIGWMTQTYMIPGFESVITADANKPFVLKTQYGQHVVLVTRKSAPVAKKQVAILEKTALASKETYNNFYSQANNFASITAGTYEGYKKALDSTKVYSHPMNITEATSTYGAIDQAKEVTRWAFDCKKAGKASQIITVNNNYFFVVALKDIHKEGYTPVEQAASTISNLLYVQKLQDKYTEETGKRIAAGQTLEQIAETLGSSVQSRSGVAFSSMAPSVEPALAGAVAKAAEGQVCGPVKGQMGVYYFVVTSRENGSFYTEEDARNMAAQKAQYASQMVLSVMTEAANLKDNRARFF